jgi:hypothetical protein
VRDSKKGEGRRKTTSPSQDVDKHHYQSFKILVTMQYTIKIIYQVPPTPGYFGFRF